MLLTWHNYLFLHVHVYTCFILALLNIITDILSHTCTGIQVSKATKIHDVHVHVIIHICM